MPMNRITGHHAASGYKPSREALAAYHKLIGPDAEVIEGNHGIAANWPGQKLVAGHYAAHTRGLNSGNIGVAILAMGGGVWSNPRGGAFPVKPLQVDGFCKEVARLAIDYSILVDRRFVLTHAEVQTTLGVKQKNKWDFDYDPRYRSQSRDPIGIGDELRQEIARIMAGMRTSFPERKQPLLQIVHGLPQLRQGATGEHVVRLQSLLGLKQDGLFGPATRDAVIRHQMKHQLLPDGMVGALTWESLLPSVRP